MKGSLFQLSYITKETLVPTVSIRTDDLLLTGELRYRAALRGHEQSTA